MAEVYNHWRSAFLAYLLNSADVFIGGDIITTDESIEFRGDEMWVHFLHCMVMMVII